MKYLCILIQILTLVVIIQIIFFKVEQYAIFKG